MYLDFLLTSSFIDREILQQNDQTIVHLHLIQTKSFSSLNIKLTEEKLELGPYFQIFLGCNFYYY